MKILNTTTNQIENLTYSPTGCDCMGDLTSSDVSFAYNRETEIHEAEQSAIDWWRAWIAAQEELDTLWASVKEDFDDESVKEIREAVERAQDCDMEDQPRAGKAAIMEWMREHDYSLKTYEDGSIAFMPSAALEYEDAEDLGPSPDDIIGCLKGVEPLALEKEPDREF